MSAARRSAMRGATISRWTHKALAALALLWAHGAAAEEVRRLATHGDWALFSDYDLCWAATTARGAPDVVMMSAFKTKGGVEFSINLPAPQPEAPATLTFAGAAYPAGVRDDWAWLRSPAEDDALHAAMMTMVGEMTLETQASTFRFSADGYRWLMEAAPGLCLQPLS